MTRPPSTPPAGASDAADTEELLARLAVHDVSPERAERIRRRAHVALREQGRREGRPAGFAWVRSYHRLVEPAVVIGLGLWQLAWTVRDTVALFH